MNCSKWILVLFAALSVVFSGCTLEEHEIREEGHVWRFVGLVDDSTALVRVTFEQWGETHDHHLMGYDDDFHWTKDTRFYPVRMGSYWRGSGSTSSPGVLERKSKLGDYGLDVVNLGDYSCGAVLLGKKDVALDTLETDNCGWDNDSALFVGNYVRIGDSFYLVKDGRFPSQKPAYSFEHTRMGVKFIDRNGDFILYGGNP